MDLQYFDILGPIIIIYAWSSYGPKPVSNELGIVSHHG